MVAINSSILRFRQQQRADTFANFNARNEVLSVGEVVFVIDQNKIKIGDGVTPFQNLNFITTDVAEVAQSVVPNIKVNKINEATSNAGITLEGVLVKDSNVTVQGGVTTRGFRVTRSNSNAEGGELRLDYPNNDGTYAQRAWRMDVNGSSDQPDLRFFRNDGISPLVAMTIGHDGKIQSKRGVSFDNGVNTLEHYEEGVFTPQYSAVDNLIYTDQTGEYTRIGNILHFRLTIEVSSIDNTDGSNVQITGLPYNASPQRVINASLHAGDSDILSSYFANEESIYFDVRNSVSVIFLQGKQGNFIRYNQINNSGRISFTGWYFV